MMKKLVIEISDSNYKDIMYEKESSPRNLSNFEIIIANSTPLEEVLEDIIEKIIASGKKFDYYHYDMIETTKVVEIIREYLELEE